MNLPLMIFAAGFGTRMGALTQDRPKPLIQVAGRPLIDHALGLAEGAGIARIAVNLHYLPHQLEAHLAQRDVTTIREAPDILDTGGGLRNALPVLGSDTVMTLNSDAVWAGPNPLSHVHEAWDPERMDALLLCAPMTQTHGYERGGDFDLQPDGRLRRGTRLVYTGVHILKTAILHKVDASAFSLNVVWNQIAQDDRLFGTAYDGHWCDVGHPGGIDAAETMLTQHDV